MYLIVWSLTRVPLSFYFLLPTSSKAWPDITVWNIFQLNLNIVILNFLQVLGRKMVLFLPEKWVPPPIPLFFLSFSFCNQMGMCWTWLAVLHQALILSTFIVKCCPPSVSTKAICLKANHLKYLENLVFFVMAWALMSQSKSNWSPLLLEEPLPYMLP